MGILLKKYALFLVLVYHLSMLSWSQEASQVATYYYAPGGLGTPIIEGGGCGYSEYGRTINDGELGMSHWFCLLNSTKVELVVVPVTRYVNLKVRCKEVECNSEGVVVMVTDHGGGSDGDETEFILSTDAFNRMALPGSEKVLMSYGKVRIAYKRVACQYPLKNLTLKIEERSQYPSYLALLFLYQAGNSDLSSVELFDVISLDIILVLRLAHGFGR